MYAKYENILKISLCSNTHAVAITTHFSAQFFLIGYVNKYKLSLENWLISPQFNSTQGITHLIFFCDLIAYWLLLLNKHPSRKDNCK